jgi:hypothetical protein
MKYPKSYNYEQIIKTIRAMPDKSDKENRDRPLYPCKPYVLCV